MFTFFQYLLLFAAWMFFGCSFVHADSERLRSYYEKLLEAEPDNDRARLFLGLPVVGETGRQVNEDTSKRNLVWKNLLDEGNQEAAFSLWKEQWEVTSPRDRPYLATSAVENFGVEIIPAVLNIVLPAFASGNPARQVLLNDAALRLIHSKDPGVVLSDWCALAQKGDIQFARAAALLAAKTGHALAWAQMLQLEADAGGEAESLWEAWLAAGDQPRAALVAADWFARKPDSPRAFLAHLEMTLRKGNTQLAAQALRSWLGKQPSSQRVSIQQSLRDLADRFGWREGTEIALRNRLDAEPFNPQAHLDLLEFFLLWKETAAAEEVFADSMSESLATEQQLDYLEKTVALQRKAGMHESAAETARLAFSKALQNKVPAEQKARLLLLLAESLRLAGKDEEALSVLQEEIGPQQASLPMQELDREFFALLSRSSTEVLRMENGAGRNEELPARSSLDLQRVVPVRRGLTPQVRKMLQSLQDHAAHSENENVWLRLARWQEWTDDLERADATLQTGILKRPDSIALRQAALQLARKLRNREREMAELKELSVRDFDPLRQATWRRELAFLELQSQEDRESSSGMLFLLERAVHPDSSADSWVDLALAYELRDEWFAAWDAWSTAWQLAPTEEERAQILIGGERTASRLGRLDGWRVLAKLKPDDLKSPPIQSENIELEEETTRDRKGNELRTLQARDAAAWLAEGERLEEANVPLDVVLDFWKEAMERFPASVPILKAAAQRIKETEIGQAVLLLLQAYEVSPPDAANALELAQLLEQTGDRTRAIDFYEKVLEWEPPSLEHESKAIFPVTLSPDERRRLTSMIFRLRSASGTWSGGWAALMERPPESPPNRRVMALRALGRILSGSEIPEERKKESMQDLTVSEALEFLISLGDIKGALAVLRPYIQSNPMDYPATISYLRLAMDAGLWEQAVELLEEKQGNIPERLDFFLAALGERILAGKDWKEFVAAEKLATLQLSTSVLWPVAQLLAETGHREIALQLADQAIPSLPLEIRDSAIQEALEWSLLRGNLNLAQLLLAQRPMLASSIVEPSAALLRARFLISSREDRTRWLDEHFRRPPPERNLSTASTRFLLAAMEGLPIEEEAAKLVDEISNATFGEGDRRMFVANIRATVEKLMDWRLEEAASILLAKALEGDEALRILRGQIDEWQRGELQALATAVAFAQQPFSELPAAAASISNLLPDNQDFLPAVGAVLAQSGDILRASLIFQVLWERGDRRPIVLSSWWPVLRTVGDTQNFGILLEELINRGEKVEGVENPHVLLIDLALAHKDWDLAASIFAKAKARGIFEPGLTERGTAIQFLTGNFDKLRLEHESLWKEQRDILSGEILARAAWLSGNQEEFFRILGEIAMIDSVVFLRVWDAALSEPTLQTDDAARLLSLAQAFIPKDEGRLFSATVAAGDVAMAEAMLENAWFPSLENLHFLSSKQNAAMNLGPSLLERWKEFVKTNPSVSATASYWQAIDALAVAADAENAWQNILSSMWKEGKGHPYAGELLLRSLARSGNHQELQRALDSFLKNNANDAVWPGLITLLNDAKFYDLALLALDAWQEDGIADDQVFSADLLRATSLNRSGQSDEASEILVPWEKIALLESQYLLPLGNWMYDAGHHQRALKLHEEGLRAGQRHLRKAHALGAARAAAALGEALTAEQYHREAGTIPGKSEF